MPGVQQPESDIEDTQDRHEESGCTAGTRGARPPGRDEERHDHQALLLESDCEDRQGRQSPRVPRPRLPLQITQEPMRAAIPTMV